MSKRKIVVIDEAKCNGCGDCIISCHEKALQIIDGKARLVKDQYCDGLGACLGKCPQDAIRIEEREAEDFNEAAVHEHIKALEEKKPQLCGCPSARLKSFGNAQPVGEKSSSASPSALTHWPVQLNLVPPTAPFLYNKDLLIVADCVPVAYGGFHTDLLPGKSVVMGCPKFDDTEYYKDKLVDMFTHAHVKSVTIAVMEVPCCSALNRVVKMAYAESKAMFPLHEVTIGVEGERK